MNKVSLPESIDVDELPHVTGGAYGDWLAGWQLAGSGAPLPAWKRLFSSGDFKNGYKYGAMRYPAVGRRPFVPIAR
jgi:hypothetical protein